MASPNCRSILSHGFRLACLIGFLTQVGLFVRLYMTYPTRTEISVKVELNPQPPPVTLCNKNRLRKCFLDKPTQLILSEMVFNYSIYKEFMRKTNANIIIEAGNNYNCSICNCNPKKFCNVGRAFHFYYYEFGTCFTMNSNITGLLATEENGQDNLTVLDFTLHFHDEDYPNVSSSLSKGKKLDVGAIALAHDPRSIPRFTANRLMLSPGKLLELIFTRIEIEYSGAPYSPYCKDYESEWLQNGKKGPLARDSCIRECVDAQLFQQNKCYPVSEVTEPVLYTWLERKCTQPKKNFSFNSFFQRCTSSCLTQCRVIEFDAHIVKTDRYGPRRMGPHGPPFRKHRDFSPTFGMKRPPSRIDWSEENLSFRPEMHHNSVSRESREEEMFSSSDVKITYKSFDFIVYSLKPEYQNIEVFSYLGGYLGMWLGASILSIPNYLYRISAWMAVRKKRRSRRTYKPQLVYVKHCLVKNI